MNGSTLPEPKTLNLADGSVGSKSSLLLYFNESCSPILRCWKVSLNHSFNMNWGLSWGPGLRTQIWSSQQKLSRQNLNLALDKITPCLATWNSAGTQSLPEEMSLFILFLMFFNIILTKKWHFETEIVKSVSYLIYEN